MSVRGALSFLVLTSCFTSVCSADWPQFRGPAANGVVTDSHPDKWGPDENIAWTKEVPGSGWAAPVITDGKIFIATAVSSGPMPGGRDRRAPLPEQSWQLHCYDLESGEQLWEKVAKKGVPTISTHQDNTYASETPVTDGKHVWVYFGMTGLYCYDLDGNEVWQKDLGSYTMQAGWGTSSSPALHDGKLFLQIDNEDESFIVALDASNGDELWRKPREEGSNWCSPVIWKNRVRAEVVTAGSNRYRSYDPDSGDLLWEFNGGGGRPSASPAGNEDMLVLGSEDRSQRGGGRGGVFAVRAGASGDISPGDDGKSEGLLWSTTEVPMGMSSPLIYDGQVYVLPRNGGIVIAFDAQTGKVNFRERLRGVRAFWSSPWASGGEIYLPGDQGKVVVIAPGPEFKTLRVNDIPGRLWSTPAASDGSLVIRYENRMVCVR